MSLLDHLATEADLDARLSAPSAADIACCRRLDGDVLVLGAAGKMGPTLVRRIVRAMAAAGLRHRVIAASRFSTPSRDRRSRRAGATTVAVDLARSGERRRAARLRIRPVSRRPQVRVDRQHLADMGDQHDRARERRAAVSHDRASSPFQPGTCIRSCRCHREAASRATAPAPRGEYAQSCLGPRARVRVLLP